VEQANKTKKKAYKHLQLFGVGDDGGNVGNQPILSKDVHLSSVKVQILPSIFICAVDDEML
jgi:hypothetical protein